MALADIIAAAKAKGMTDAQVAKLLKAPKAKYDPKLLPGCSRCEQCGYRSAARDKHEPFVICSTCADMIGQHFYERGALAGEPEHAQHYRLKWAKVLGLRAEAAARAEAARIADERRERYDRLIAALYEHADALGLIATHRWNWIAAGERFLSPLVTAGTFRRVA